MNEIAFSMTGIVLALAFFAAALRVAWVLIMDKTHEPSELDGGSIASGLIAAAINRHVQEEDHEGVERHVKNLFSKDIDRVESALFGLYCIIYKITDVE